MTRHCAFPVSILLAAATLLGGCAAPAGYEPSDATAQRDQSTTSDRTDIQKRARIRLQLAVSYYEQRQLPVALDEVKRAIATDPEYADAYSMRALIYMDMGETRQADESFQAALRLAPNNPDYQNNYGRFLCENHQETRALTYFDAALKNKSYQSPGKALLNAGLCSIRLNRDADAERYLLDAFRYEPGNPVVSFNLAQIYYRRHDYERAKFYVTRAVKSDLVTADMYWLAIRIARKTDDRNEENTLALQLRRRFPDSSELAAYQRGEFNE